MKPVRFRAYSTVAQALNDSAEIKMVLGTVDFDTCLGWDATNNRYVVKKRGYYLVVGTCGITALPDTAAGYVVLFVDGVASRRGSTILEGAAGNVTFNVSGVILLNPDSYIELFAYQNSGGALNTAGTNLKDSLSVVEL